MKMTKKFDGLNETFNVTGEIVSNNPETSVEKIEKISNSIDDVKKDFLEVTICLLNKSNELKILFYNLRERKFDDLSRVGF